MRFLTGDTHPDHDTICTFRREHFDAVAACFVHVLELALELKLHSVGLLATALRLAAYSMHSSTSALGAYYRRMRARLGAPKAITATAHKLARLVYRMLKYGQDYLDIGQTKYEEQYRIRRLRALITNAKKMGYELVHTQTGEIVS